MLKLFCILDRKHTKPCSRRHVWVTETGEYGKIFFW